MIKFFNSNRITIKAELSQLKLFDNSATVPTPVEPQHPYGTQNNKINFSVNNDEHRKDYENLQPNTPEWADADSHIKNHFGGKISLDDLAKTYSLPGLKRQYLNFSVGHTFKNGDKKPVVDINYNGNTDADLYDYSGNNKRFSFDLRHGFDDENNHDVYWGSMRNEDKTAPHLLNLVSQSLPTYQKAGIKGISTSAVSSGKHMNGAHTWANLGFDFKEPDERKYTQNNLMRLTKDFEEQGIPMDSLRQKIINSTHPFELQDVARKLAVLEKQLPQKKITDMWGEEIPVQRRDVHQIWSHALSGYESNGGSFQARLSADPKDKGHQRMLSFLKYMRGKK